MTTTIVLVRWYLHPLFAHASFSIPTEVSTKQYIKHQQELLLGKKSPHHALLVRFLHVKVDCIERYKTPKYWCTYVVVEFDVLYSKHYFLPKSNIKHSSTLTNIVIAWMLVLIHNIATINYCIAPPQSI